MVGDVVKPKACDCCMYEQGNTVGMEIYDYSDYSDLCGYCKYFPVNLLKRTFDHGCIHLNAMGRCNHHLVKHAYGGNDYYAFCNGSEGCGIYEKRGI